MSDYNNETMSERRHKIPDTGKLFAMATNPGAKMGLRYAPYAFTEHGVAMLSSVLRSPRAVEVNIAIVRTFVKLRQMLATNEELARTVVKHNRQITVLFGHVQRMLAPPPTKKIRTGFASLKANKQNWKSQICDLQFWFAGPD
jgi:hypothetical protein